MFATLPLKMLISILVIPSGLLFAAWYWIAPPETVTELAKLVSGSATAIGVIFFVIGGSAGRLAPWRWLWRFSLPNTCFFPDINGTWEGTTRSNWPLIQRLAAAAATKKEKLGLGELDDVQLQEDCITLEIKATFFSLRIFGTLANTGGTSHSLTARVVKNDVKDCFELHYVYDQTTPSPKATDENSHRGAASLDIDLERNCLAGNYWNRRKWQQGLNTAGQISVKRTSRFVQPGDR